MRMKLLEFCNTYLLGVGVPLCLGLAGLFFLFRLRAFPFLHPWRVMRTVMKKSDAGGISPLRALSMALAGTLGVGNLVGVAAAIAAGGAGAIFWMWISATLAMLLKYAETVLALRHRRMDAGGVRGGAMYYMRDAFGGRLAWLGRGIAFVFAALCLVDAFSMGCVVQVNAMASAWQGLWNVPTWLTGLLVGLAVFAVGLGGAKAISGATEKLVPLMTVGFVAVSLVAIFLRIEQVPALLAQICTSAFKADTASKSVLGGVGGFLLSRALRFGTMRGLLSNEAGCGTSPMAHATAATTDDAKQGCLGIVEVFVDTHLLCTMTALVVLLAWDEVSTLGDAPMLMTLRAYEALLGPWAGVFLCVSVLCFGLATVFCWSHYATEACVYLVGERGRRTEVMRKLCLFVYCMFCVVGAVVAPDSVWTVADFSIGLMTLLNVVVLCRMHREVEGASGALMR
ncbi:MAG: sodium:alanine symporter family protein [Ruminococcaceae bacterium]|nr:sodium:alanine symporter family protein [Oscillospiraceae bacterium]